MYAANGTGSLVFIDDVTADKSSRMNSEVFRAILSDHIQPNASELIGRRFTDENCVDVPIFMDLTVCMFHLCLIQ